ncbi:hypothetical protein CRG49_005275 [Neisseria sp. N95_16]|uniref:Uncharacterized protein n=1 Tax=Neisseria brasiliensis TaxID=2666100 RepID=A0A7X2GYM6_9NEIS|nr:hypothetical protein [Neisseria brasiliensis]MRN38122.1 hypothetical protein [Neisseria brasiliensis]PJO09889.1 hypothetical protein CRG49_005275 [Neisseria sp. N95_16]PJO79036.1 hypothetical protein CWC45_01800 [Neisseria sp. N177_16]
MKENRSILAEIFKIMSIYVLFNLPLNLLNFEWQIFKWNELNSFTICIILLSLYIIFLAYNKEKSKIIKTLSKIKNFLLIFYYALSVSYFIRIIFSNYANTNIYKYGSIFLVAIIVYISVKLYMKIEKELSNERN